MFKGTAIAAPEVLLRLDERLEQAQHGMGVYDTKHRVRVATEE